MSSAMLEHPLWHPLHTSATEDGREATTHAQEKGARNLGTRQAYVKRVAAQPAPSAAVGGAGRGAATTPSSATGCGQRRCCQRRPRRWRRGCKPWRPPRGRLDDGGPRAGLGPVAGGVTRPAGAGAPASIAAAANADGTELTTRDD